MHGKVSKTFGWGGARTKWAAPARCIGVRGEPQGRAGQEGLLWRLGPGKKAFFGGWEPGTVFGPAAHFAAEDLKIGPLNT